MFMHTITQKPEKFRPNYCSVISINYCSKFFTLCELTTCIDPYYQSISLYSSFPGIYGYKQPTLYG